MRIAIYSDNFYPELSGISDTIIASGKQLAKRGHQINYFVPKYSDKNYKLLKLENEEIILDKNIKITRFFSLAYPTGTKQSRLVIPCGLGAISLKKFNPDVIHSNHIAGVGLEALADAKLTGKPLVGTNHTPIIQFLSYSPIKGKWFQRMVSKYDAWYYNQCSFVTSPSSPVLEEMKKYGFKSPSKVVPNPINVNIFRSLEAKKELKKELKIPDFTLFYCGRLAPEKNVDLMIRAAANLKKSIPELGLVIAGKGSSEPDLRKLTEELRLSESTRFFGFIESEEKFAEFYNANDIFVMASVAETQSISMMNAMACEIPVIAVNSWGLRDYVHDQKNGLMIEPGDQKALEEKVLLLYKDQKERERLGKGAREYASQFSPEKIALQWEEVYQKAIDLNSHKRSSR